MCCSNHFTWIKTALANENFWEWPSGLRHCSNWKVPCSKPTKCLARIWDPTLLWGSWWPLGRKCKTQWLTTGEWGCPLDNGPKLAMGQLNSSLKKKSNGSLTFILLFWGNLEKYTFLYYFTFFLHTWRKQTSLLHWLHWLWKSNLTIVTSTTATTVREQSNLGY